MRARRLIAIPATAILSAGLLTACFDSDDEPDEGGTMTSESPADGMTPTDGMTPEDGMTEGDSMEKDDSMEGDSMEKDDSMEGDSMEKDAMEGEG